MTVLDILGGVEAVLKTVWPEAAGEEQEGTVYYQDRAPVGFTRPSFLVEAGKIKQTEVGGYTTTFSLPVRIVSFLPTDAYHHCKVSDLAQRMSEVMALFSGGAFPVGEGEEARYPHVEELEGDHGLDYAEVTLHVSFNDRWDPEEPYPLCESVNINIKEE